MGLSRTDGLWIHDEISKADFGDIRLNKRFQFIATELASNPSAPINQASSDWAAAKAAYRFFDNPKIQGDKILEPHILNTQLRMQSYEQIVVVQDTSLLDFTKHPKTTGLGSIGKTPSDFEPQGLLLHTALALTEKGLPLGILDQEIWPRLHKKEKNTYLRKLLPPEKKESFKWFKSLRRVHQRTLEVQQITLVCDREGDIYDFFEECLDLQIDFVIRVRQERMLEDEDIGDIGLFDRLGIEEPKAKIKIKVPGSGKRSERVAEVEVRFLAVTYASRPRGVAQPASRDRADLDLFVVHLHEINPPKGEEGISWTLATSLSVRSLQEALKISELYRLRWNVELYFKCLKTGCTIEDCRLASAEKLIRYVTLNSIIAWRILWMTFLNRNLPEESCENFLTENEWKTLWIKKNKRKIKNGEIKPIPPQKPPSTYEAVRWLAGLGGFLGRKHDKEPGLITVWRGWKELSSAAEIYDLLKTKPTPR